MGEPAFKTYKVARVLLIFSNETDEPVAEFPFASFDLLNFKRHFGVPDEDEDTEMYLDYVVEPGDTEFLSQHLGEAVDFDFRKYAYFVSCYRVDE